MSIEEMEEILKMLETEIENKKTTSVDRFIKMPSLNGEDSGVITAFSHSYFSQEERIMNKTIKTELRVFMGLIFPLLVARK